MNPFSKKLLYLSDIPNTKICRLKIFDIEEERVFEEKLVLRILTSLSETTQINFMKSLYVCGVNPSSSSNVGSYLIKITPDVPSQNIHLLVSSIYSHSCPSMIGWMNEEILIIGGKAQIECEYYIMKQSRWRQLPSLPEDRYKATLLSDEANQYIYLFGGLCSIGNKNVKTILRMNMGQTLVWEMILIKENESLLGRNSSVALQYDINGSIYILGGYNDQGKPTDFITEYDPLKKSVRQYHKQLEKVSVFDQQIGVELNKIHFAFFDNEGYIIKISKTDFRIVSYNYEEMQGRAFS